MLVCECDARELVRLRTVSARINTANNDSTGGVLKVKVDLNVNRVSHNNPTTAVRAVRWPPGDSVLCDTGSSLPSPSISHHSTLYILVYSWLLNVHCNTRSAKSPPGPNSVLHSN